MSTALRQLLADARLPNGRLSCPGGVEAACAHGLVHDLASLREFLFGRLWTAGTVAGFAAAAVCARAVRAPESYWRTAEAELDARIPSPAARDTSRRLGGRLLDLAAQQVDDPLFNTLGRNRTPTGLPAHFPVAVGVVAAVGGLSSLEAAEAAAYAYVAGPAFAACRVLQLEPARIVELGLEMAPEVTRLAREAAAGSLRSLSQLPSLGAPGLEFLAEEPAPARSQAVGT